MKKIIPDILCNIIGVLMTLAPLYCFGIAPLFLTATNIYFDTKHNNKFVLWRMALVILFLYGGYLIEIFLYKLQTQEPISFESQLVMDWAFGISAIITAVAFIIYQLLVLIAIRIK